MHNIIVTYLPWALSAITIWMLVMTGNKDKKGWALGALNQVLWAVWIFYSHSWGLLPITIAMVVVSLRNYRKWKKEEKLVL